MKKKKKIQLKKATLLSILSSLIFSQLLLSARFGLPFLSYITAFLTPGVTEVGETKLEDCERDQVEKLSQIRVHPSSVSDCSRQNQ